MRAMFSPEQFYAMAQTDVVHFSSFEKTPEDICNIDSKIVDKCSNKDKSILLSGISQRSSKNLLTSKDINVKYPEANMQNIIFNKLYDEHALKHHENQLSYDNEITTNGIKYNSENDGESNEHRKVPNRHVLLFAENQSYGVLSPSDNCVCTKSYDQEKISEQIKLEETYQQLTGKDLLMFAKQIATGMVRVRYRL